MSEAYIEFPSVLPRVAQEDGNDMICTYLVILGIILIILYWGLYFYNRRLASKRTKQHPCKYCGHMVDAVSDCCNSSVEESFMKGRCASCGKECKVICARCKRQLWLKS